MSEEKSVTCSLCSQEVMCEDYRQCLSDYHIQEQCEQHGAQALGAVGLLQQLEEFHLLSCPTDLPDVAALTTPIAQPDDTGDTATQWPSRCSCLCSCSSHSPWDVSGTPTTQTHSAASWGKLGEFSTKAVQSSSQLTWSRSPTFYMTVLDSWNNTCLRSGSIPWTPPYPSQLLIHRIISGSGCSCCSPFWHLH